MAKGVWETMAQGVWAAMSRVLHPSMSNTSTGIDIQPPPRINHICVTVPNEENSQANNRRSLIRSAGGLMEGHVSQSKNQKEGLVSKIVEILGIKRIYEMKIVHVRSLACLKFMCEEIKDMDMQQMRDSSVDPAIFQAVGMGNVEFIAHICKANPELLRSVNPKKRGIFHFAIECRQEKIYDLIYGISTKDWMTNLVDSSSNNMLHMAGLLSPSAKLNRIPGAALQMQRELQLFVARIFAGDVSWPTSTQLPERLKPVDAFCRASASLAGLSGKALSSWSGKSCRAKLKKKDKVNFERCLCGALGVGLEAHNQG